MQPIKIIAFFAVFLFPFLAFGADAGGRTLQNDGKVVIYNYHANECREVRYREGNRYLPGAQKEISELLRSKGDATTTSIDLRLIELIDHLQDHFNADEVEVISGFRSQDYNQSLRDAGRGAARESLHTRGQALDIHLDEVDEETLFNYISSLKLGGVGIYPRYLFVHADVGPVRTWRETAGEKRVLIGTENNPNPMWSVITDKNSYKPGEVISAAVQNNDYGSQRFVTNVWIERFRRGEWKEQQQIDDSKKSVSLDASEKTAWSWQVPEDLALGKYRLVVFAGKDLKLAPAYSNEFYIRK